MRRVRGFTLIELMIVVAIIGILAAIATGKFSELVARSKEAKVKDHLGTLRSALSIYYSDNQSYPSDPATALTAGGTYLKEIPQMEIPAVASQSNPGHTAGNTITTTVDDGATGNWSYVMTSNQQGEFLVNCSHNDTRGSAWTTQ